LYLVSSKRYWINMTKKLFLKALKKKSSTPRKLQPRVNLFHTYTNNSPLCQAFKEALKE
jgi:hypothetical protein